MAYKNQKRQVYTKAIFIKILLLLKTLKTTSQIFLLPCVLERHIQIISK